MTTFEPGAIEVFTHGLIARPRSTAFLASSAAPSITDGFDVLVHEVMEEITTAPWSSSNDAPSARVTVTGRLARPSAPSAAENTDWCGASSSDWPPGAAGSLAGKVSSTDSSTDGCRVEAASSGSVWSGVPA